MKGPFLMKLIFMEEDKIQKINWSFQELIQKGKLDNDVAKVAQISIVAKKIVIQR